MSRSESDGSIKASGRPVETPFALTDGSLTPAGRVIAADEARGVFLYEVDRPAAAR